MPDDIDDIADVVGEEGDPPSEPDDQGDTPELPEGETAAPSDDDTAVDGEPGEEPEADAAAPSAFDELLLQYGGDPEKLATSHREQANSVAKLHEKFAALEKALEGRGTPEDQQKVIAEDPQVQELAGDLTSYDAEVKEMDAQIRQYVADWGQAGVVIANLEGQLKFASPEDAPQIRHELAEARANQKAIHANHGNLVREHNRTKLQLRNTARQYRAAIDAVKAKQDQATQAAILQQQTIVQVKEVFDVSVRAAAQRYGVELGSARYNMLRASVKSRINEVLDSLPDDQEGLPIEDAVNALFDDFASTMGLKANFARKSAQKNQVDGRPTTKAPVTVPSKKLQPGDKGKWTAEYVRARARRLMP